MIVILAQTVLPFVFLSIQNPYTSNNPNPTLPNLNSTTSELVNYWATD